MYTDFILHFVDESGNTQQLLKNEFINILFFQVIADLKWDTLCFKMKVIFFLKE